MHVLWKGFNETTVCWDMEVQGLSKSGCRGCLGGIYDGSCYREKHDSTSTGNAGLVVGLVSFQRTDCSFQEYNILIFVEKTSPSCVYTLGALRISFQRVKNIG